MAAIVPGDGFDLAQLHRHLVDRLPDYARPVFLRLRDGIALTGTFKPQKQQLAAEGLRPGRDERRPLFDDRRQGAYVCAGYRAAPEDRGREDTALGGAAGVDRQHRAGDVARLVAHQELDRVGDIVDLRRDGRAGCGARTRSRSAWPMSSVIAVSTKPGATALTVMPSGPTSRASDLVKPMSEALVAA